MTDDDLLREIREQLYLGNVIALAAFKTPDLTRTDRGILASEIEAALQRTAP